MYCSAAHSDHESQNKTRCTLTQQTSYPIAHTTELQFDLATPETFTVYLRIPGWADAKTLDRLEHRKQYKGNISKVFNFGKHDLSIYGIGYYGTAFQPGLIPIDRPVPDDTVDPRQHEETSNGALIVNDVWHLNDHRQFQFSGFYRYYTLDVRPNFGDGLIRQSEHRNVNSEDVLYTDRFSNAFSLLAGVDLRREAPRALNLDKADDLGVFHPDTSNNLTINFYSPFAALDGKLLSFLHYNAGYRVD